VRGRDSRRRVRLLSGNASPCGEALPGGRDAGSCTSERFEPSEMYSYSIFYVSFLPGGGEVISLRPIPSRAASRWALADIIILFSSQPRGRRRAKLRSIPGGATFFRKQIGTPPCRLWRHPPSERGARTEEEGAEHTTTAGGVSPTVQL
jgi:hypothetical protein